MSASRRLRRIPLAAVAAVLLLVAACAGDDGEQSTEVTLDESQDDGTVEDGPEDSTPTRLVGEYGSGEEHLRVHVAQDADAGDDVCFLVDLGSDSRASCDLTLPPDGAIEARPVSFEDTSGSQAVVGVVAEPVTRLDVVGAEASTLRPELVPVGGRGASAFGVPMLEAPLTLVAYDDAGTERGRTVIEGDEPEGPDTGTPATSTTSTTVPPEDPEGALDDGLLEEGERGPAVEIWQERYNDWASSQPDGPEPVPEDGVFGATTVEATQLVQLLVGIPTDGIVGPRTSNGLELLIDGFEGSVRPRTAPPSSAEVSLVTEARLGNRGTTDRVVIEMGSAGTPGYDVRYLDGPVRQDGSGNVVEVEGDATLAITLTQASAHSPESGEPTYDGPDRIEENTTVVNDLVLVSDFEGQVTWAVGLDRQVPFEVFVLQDPSRIVVDLASV